MVSLVPSLALAKDERADIFLFRRLVPVRPLGHLLSLCYELDLHKDYRALDAGPPPPELLDRCAFSLPLAHRATHLTSLLQGFEPSASHSFKTDWFRLLRETLIKLPSSTSLA